MWVNVLLFLVAVATAVYLYLTRNFGWFKAHGVFEHDAALPFGCAEANEVFMGRRNIQRVTEPIYFRYALNIQRFEIMDENNPIWFQTPRQENGRLPHLQRI